MSTHISEIYRGNISSPKEHVQESERKDIDRIVLRENNESAHELSEYASTYLTIEGQRFLEICNIGMRGPVRILAPVANARSMR